MADYAPEILSHRTSTTMTTVLQTSDADLRRISQERGKEYDPDKHTAWCGECGAPLGRFGIMHWPDCSGDEAEIRFREVS